MEIGDRGSGMGRHLLSLTLQFSFIGRTAREGRKERTALVGVGANKEGIWRIQQREELIRFGERESPFFVTFEESHQGRERERERERESSFSHAFRSSMHRRHLIPKLHQAALILLWNGMDHAKHNVIFRVGSVR